MTISPDFNGTPVPWTTAWSDEDANWHLTTSHYTGDRALLSQKSAIGSGRPLFTTVHMERQRAAMIQGRCDVCGKVIGKHQARVLLAEPDRLKGTDLQGHVMAPSHRECARLAATVCPWILRQIECGKLTVTVVLASSIALAQIDPDIVESQIGRRVAVPVFGHAKMIVNKALRRDAEWLMRVFA